MSVLSLSYYESVKVMSE